jgi:hypothetical protein
MTKKNYRQLHLKQWNTGIGNPIKEPVLMIESTEGENIMIVMPIQTAKELGKALSDNAEKLTALAGKPN